MQLLYGNNGQDYQILAKSSEITDNIYKELEKLNLLKFNPDAVQPAITIMKTELNGQMQGGAVVMVQSQRMTNFNTPCYMSHVHILPFMENYYRNAGFKQLLETQFIQTEDVSKYRGKQTALEQFEWMGEEQDDREVNVLNENQRMAILGLLMEKDNDRTEKILIVVDADSNNYEKRTREIVADLYTHMPYGWRERVGFSTYGEGILFPGTVKLQFVDVDRTYQNRLGKNIDKVDINSDQQEEISRMLNKIKPEYRAFLESFLEVSEEERKKIFEQYSKQYDNDDSMEMYYIWETKKKAWLSQLNGKNGYIDEQIAEKLMEEWHNFIEEKKGKKVEEDFHHLISEFLVPGGNFLYQWCNEKMAEELERCYNLNQNGNQTEIQKSILKMQQINSIFEFISCPYQKDLLFELTEHILEGKFPLEYGHAVRMIFKEQEEYKENSLKDELSKLDQKIKYLLDIGNYIRKLGAWINGNQWNEVVTYWKGKIQEMNQQIQKEQTDKKKQVKETELQRMLQQVDKTLYLKIPNDIEDSIKFQISNIYKSLEYEENRSCFQQNMNSFFLSWIQTCKEADKYERVKLNIEWAVQQKYLTQESEDKLIREMQLLKAQLKNDYENYLNWDFPEMIYQFINAIKKENKNGERVRIQFGYDFFDLPLEKAEILAKYMVTPKVLYDESERSPVWIQMNEFVENSDLREIFFQDGLSLTKWHWCVLFKTCALFNDTGILTKIASEYCKYYNIEPNPENDKYTKKVLIQYSEILNEHTGNLEQEQKKQPDVSEERRYEILEDIDPFNKRKHEKYPIAHMVIGIGIPIAYLLVIVLLMALTSISPIYLTVIGIICTIIWLAAFFLFRPKVYCYGWHMAGMIAVFLIAVLSSILGSFRKPQVMQKDIIKEEENKKGTEVKNNISEISDIEQSSDEPVDADKDNIDKLKKDIETEQMGRLVSDDGEDITLYDKEDNAIEIPLNKNKKIKKIKMKIIGDKNPDSNNHEIQFKKSVDIITRDGKTKRLKKSESFWVSASNISMEEKEQDAGMMWAGTLISNENGDIILYKQKTMNANQSIIIPADEFDSLEVDTGEENLETHNRKIRFKSDVNKVTAANGKEIKLKNRDFWVLADDVEITEE